VREYQDVERRGKVIELRIRKLVRKNPCTGFKKGGDTTGSLRNLKSSVRRERGGCEGDICQVA